jgi:hypothetical protein
MEELLRYMRSKGRVCPRPDKWLELYAMLPGKKRRGTRCEPPAPLLHVCWRVTSERQKRERFEAHVRHAAREGELARVSRFIYALPRENWIYAGGSEA